jgi:tryptophan 6-halogenase
MSKEIKNVTIVGGGSAGWMTAAYLNKALGESVNVSLVESANISTVGVGEATFSTIKLFFDFLGLDEQDWMPQCNATYKLAIKFVDWNAEKQHFYHPFQRYEMINGFSMAEWWLKLKGDIPNPFDYSCFTVPAMCDAKRSPRFLDGGVFDNKVADYFKSERAFQKNVLSDLKIQYPYAYQFNAGLLANFLRDFAIQNGVKHIVDDVLDVRMAEDGSIDHILTKEHDEIGGDLFIDCTGFKGLLINKALEEPFISFSESLLCDSAIAMQIPRNIEKDGINPYTTATALSSGWVWNIPLYGRDGTGYVYSSAFKSPEEAEKEFRKHLGSASDGCKAAHIKMRIGRNRNSWVKNCIAIGLSSGFVEPLESTGIFFIQHGIEELVASFPNQSLREELMKGYNANVAECIDGVRDFLVLHYCASTRNDSPFWKATKHDLKIPVTVEERFKAWKTRLPNQRNINLNYHGFESYSYSVMLMGLGYRPESHLPVLDHMPDKKARAAFRSIKERTEYLCGNLPSQYEYLTAMRQKVLEMDLDIASMVVD